MVVEAMTYPLPETAHGELALSAYDVILSQLAGKRCLALGPGIGTASETAELIGRVIRQNTTPMVIDADGLNIVAQRIDILKKRPAPTILTPHPGEMARLAGCSAREVQGNRIAIAREFAKRCGVHLVLKGARTVIAHPDGTVFINPTGNAGMASGGMGDVLTGIIAGLMTQAIAPQRAAAMGVFLHGSAADALAHSAGPFGYLATDVMNAIPQQIKRMAAGKLFS
jgi:NAD(P)H-hydrate epimerase